MENKERIQSFMKGLETALGIRVRELRKAKGWSQAELATRLSDAGAPMHQTTVAKLEAANRPTNLYEIGALAAIFDLPVASLFDPYNADEQGGAALAAVSVALKETHTSFNRLLEALRSYHRSRRELAHCLEGQFLLLDMRSKTQRELLVEAVGALDTELDPASFASDIDYWSSGPSDLLFPDERDRVVAEVLEFLRAAEAQLDG